MTEKIDLSGNILFMGTNLINKICKPLSTMLDVPCFCYCKIYDDGSRIILSNLPNVISYFFEERHYLNTWYFNGAPASAYNSGKNRWITERNDLTAGQSILDEDLKRHFKLHEGVDYIEKTERFTEVFGFAARTGHIYKINDHTFKHFNFAFKEQARNLIHAAEKEKIYIPLSSNSVLPKKLTDLEADFIKKTPIKRYYISSLPNVYLTPREIDCLQWYRKGKTSKEISILLKISARTIEHHVESVKRKLQCNNITQLIATAKNLGIISF